MTGRPRRIQLRRSRGWRKPEGVVVVSRPSRWGNPFAFDDYPADLPKAERRRLAVADFRRMFEGGHPAEAAAYPSAEEVRGALAGRDLACWCPLDGPCHADVLLEVANGG